MRILNKDRGIGKKGQLLSDIFIFLIVIFAFGIITILSAKILHEYQLNTNTTFGSAANNATIAGRNTVASMDGIFAFIIGAMFVVSIITAFLLRSHPIFFIVSLIVLVIVILLSAIFSNIFTQISQTNDLVNETATYTIIPGVLDKLPLFILIFGAITIIVLYAKSRSEG